MSADKCAILAGHREVGDNASEAGLARGMERRVAAVAQTSALLGL